MSICSARPAKRKERPNPSFPRTRESSAYKGKTQAHRGGAQGFTGLLIAIALTAIFSGCTPQNKTAPEVASTNRPNILFIVIDTLRADRVHAVRNGQPVMPFLAELAAKGAYYPNAISPCSWTKPAMASLFTGVYPDTHGVLHSAREEDPDHPTSDRLADSWETLPEGLAAAGYTPWAFQTNANLTAALGFAQGFREDHYLFHNGARAEQVTKAALIALAELPPPLFLYAHYMDPHAPYDPAPEFADALGPFPALPPYDDTLLRDNDAFMSYYQDQVKTAIGLQTQHLLPQLSEAGKEAVRHRYDLECYAADQALRRLVEQAWALNPETVVIVLSDHGEEFWEHGGMGHGVTLHAEQTRVPLIIVDPSVSPALRDEAVSTLVLRNYLAKRLDLPRITGADGPVLSFTRGPWPALGIHQRAIVDPSFALIEDLARHQIALYNWQLDPAEQVNVASGQLEQLHRLQELLQDHAPAASATTASVPLSEQEIEALEAVGYLDTAPPK